MEKWRIERKRERDRKKKEQESAEAISGLKIPSEDFEFDLLFRLGGYNQDS